MLFHRFCAIRLSGFFHRLFSVPVVMGASLVLCVLTSGTVMAGEAEAGDATEWRHNDVTYFVSPSVDIDREISGDVVMTGAYVQLGPRAKIDGDAWLSGRHVALEGLVMGSVEIYGSRVVLNGTVKGDVLVFAQEMQLGPDAKIDGDLSYTLAQEPDVALQAIVAGSLNGSVLGETWAGSVPELSERTHTRARDVQKTKTETPRETLLQDSGLAFSMAIVLGFIASVVAISVPNLLRAPGKIFDERPAQTLGFGLLWLIGLPAVVGVATVSLVGLPIGLVLMVIYPLMLFTGLIVSLALLGALIRRVIPFEGDVLTTTLIGVWVGVLALWIGTALPLVGVLIWTAAITAGTGAVLIVIKEKVLD